jgi:uncharacterized protein (TIGR00299 family) protein
MGQIMYVECRAGAAGDMLLGALLDAGLPLSALEQALGSLQVDHQIVVSKVVRAGVTATKVDVRPRTGHQSHDHPHRHDGDASGLASHGHSHDTHDHRSLDEIAHLIRQSALSAAGKERAIALFRRLGEAEAAIHGVPVDQIHLHEVGSLDSIIDIVGLVFALEWLGITDVVVSPINVGGGTVEIAHGRFPVPAPATLALLKGVPVYSGGPEVELVTPTGALILSDYASAFGAMPPMTPTRIGYGAGTRDFAQIPNVVRIVIGERLSSVVADATGESVVKIECEIDDMSPQLYGPASERLFEAGALDVYLTAIQMKKGRPGTLVTVLASADSRQRVCDVLFRETTTIGVRFTVMERETMDRKWETVAISGGPVRIKLASRNGATVNAVPEFDDCLRIAQSTGRPVKDVQAEALGAWISRPAIE